MYVYFQPSRIRFAAIGNGHFQVCRGAGLLDRAWPELPGQASRRAEERPALVCPLAGLDAGSRI